MIILALWWGKFSSLGILKNHDVSTLRKNLTLTPLPTLIDKFLQKLKLEPCESFRYLFRMLSDSKRCFAFAVHEFSTHGHGCSKLTRQSKIHEHSTYSTSSKTIIETSREHFNISIYGWKHSNNVTFWSAQIVQILCDSDRGSVFQKLGSHKLFTRSGFPYARF